MIPMISISGTSGSGKTTLIEKLIPELNKRGYKIASIKHDAHTFEIDKEGKDSYRHKHAGAMVTIISAPDKLALISDVDHDHNPYELSRLFFQEIDLIICEGFKHIKMPKIEVYRKDIADGLVCSGEEGLIAVAADEKISNDFPIFDINDIKSIAGFIEDKFISEESEDSILLYVNNKKIPLKKFIQDLLINAIFGMISTLKGCESPDQVAIHLFRGRSKKEI